MPDRLEIGRITKPHGLNGDVLVKFITDRLDERTAPGAEIVTVSDRMLTVERASPHKDRWIVHFAEIDTREQAESLHGHLLFADPLEDTGDVFVHDLIGKRLLTPDGTDHGAIVSVVANPASDLMELVDGRLVPLTFYEWHDDTTVTVDVPPGLLDDEG